MEMSNQFKQVFNVIDANGDGKISCSELSEVLRCLGYEKSKAAWEAERMVRVMDCNGDGAIDLDEFISAVNDDGNFGSGNKEDYLMDVFLIFDTDKNGVISARELQTVLISLGCKKCSLEDCRRMIKGVDKDGDGFVDFHEFRSMMTTKCKLPRRLANEPRTPSLLSCFAALCYLQAQVFKIRSQM
ncbi:CALCIUM-BINDING PROTEIN CML25-RELATED [Salix koriyanagi]|uniref:CALCIUM-BINDING PROTEIN CML25-RELATED n=1 Tax=Salix koriyanagi TaxID=2511006 RepID=A0A9Q0U3E1_9ROSI|nr:CALCIUM-BINDING PROTEIN CML25-RELATED [Salix koriyanagi]